MKEHRSIVILILFLILLWHSCHSGSRISKGESKEDIISQNYTVLEGYSWYDPMIFRNQDAEYDDGIASVKLQRMDVEFSLPLLELGKPEQLELSFDDLGGNPRYFRYTFIHCDAYWNPSEILQSDYLYPYTEGRLEDYLLSRATRQSYVHYKLAFPEEDMRISKSGNYLLVLFDPAKQNNLVLTRRFMVVENRVSIKIALRKSSVIEESSYKQEVDFELVKSNWPIENPYRELKVFIRQNGRQDNLVAGLEPRLVSGNSISYNWEKINTFHGGNEFRHFDLRTLSRITPRVAYIEQDSSFHHVYLKPDYKRGFQVYQTEKDLNGEYIIRNDDAHANTGNEEDYAWVHFTFPFQSSFGQRDIYLFGALTNWQIQPDAKLRYNEDRNSYQAALFLKQGYYNYHYVMLDSTGTKGETVLTEGDHSETENFYTVLIYQRIPSELYDRLIGVERVTTLQQP